MTSYTTKFAAKRAAEKMIAAGKASAADYGFRQTADGRFEINWKKAAPAAKAPTERAAQPAKSNGAGAAPKASRVTAKAAVAREAAEKGILPIPPDFSAATHKPYRGRLAELQLLAERGDLTGLKKVEMIPPRSSSPKALHRYRDLAMIALKARQDAAK